MRRSVTVICLVLLVLFGMQATSGTPASAAVGGVLRVLHPQPPRPTTGNGRAVAHDPRTRRLYYTDAGDAAIHVIRQDGSFVATLRTASPQGALVVYGAFAWQPTADGGVLWGGRFDGCKAAPSQRYSLARVTKNDTSTVLQEFDFGSSEGPEGIALDRSSFPGRCALWSNRFGDLSTLRAWQLPTGLCRAVPPAAPLPAASLRTVGLLTFHVLQANGQPVLEHGQPEVRGCVATVVDSANLSTIVTAGHCLAGTGSFPGEHVDLQFAPGHVGQCWDANYVHQLEVSQCPSNPYGVWYAQPPDIHMAAEYNPPIYASADFAFTTVHPAPTVGPVGLVQSVVGGVRIIYDDAIGVVSDPLQSETWLVPSYASDDPDFTKQHTFGPFVCPWTGNPSDSLLYASSDRIGVGLSGPCANFGTTGPRLFALPLLPGGAPFGFERQPVRKPAQHT